MSADSFEVRTSTLRTTAARLGAHADTARTVSQKASGAEVETKSWGALGLGLGLYDGYTAARAGAERSLGELVSFLADTRAALESTARDYDEADQAGGSLFTGIQDGMSGGAR